MSRLSYVTLQEAVDTNISLEQRPQRLAVKDVVCKVSARATRLRTAVQREICTQLSGKWEYAAKRHRNEQGANMPEDPKPTYSPAGFRWSSRLLPKDVADEKMQIWLPWAIQELRQQYEQLARQFGTLGIQQHQRVTNEPEADIDG